MGRSNDEEEQPLVSPADLPDPTHTDPAPLADTHQDTAYKDATPIAFTLLSRFHPFH